MVSEGVAGHRENFVAHTVRSTVLFSLSPIFTPDVQLRLHSRTFVWEVVGADL